MVDYLIGLDFAVQITHHLVNLNRDFDGIALKPYWVDSRIDQLPLAGPIIPYAVSAIHVSAFHPIGPNDVLMHPGQRAFDISRIERIIKRF